MCSNKLTSPIPAAKFVVSDNGEQLFPRNAPETTAPVVIASLKPKICPIPKNAIPIVEIVVNELPTVIPTIVQTKNAVGKKKRTEINWNP